MNIVLDVNVNVKVGGGGGDSKILGEIKTHVELLAQALMRVLENQGEIMDELAALKQQVTENTRVEAGAVVLIKGLAAKLDAMAEDPAAIRALSQELKNSAGALSQAITDNTPASEPQTTEVPPQGSM